MDMKKGIWTFKTVAPHYELTGDYVGSGRILLLPLGGKGLANFTLNDLGLDFIIYTTKKAVNGMNIYYVDKVKTTLTFQPGKNYLDIDRKEGDLTLADHTRKFLGEHADEVYAGLKGTLEDTYSELLTQLIRKLLNKDPSTKLIKNA